MAEIVFFLRAAYENAVPFKATAGLHHAVRRTDAQTGFMMHGFLNLLAEIVAPYLLLGVGVNVNVQIAEHLPDATALREVYGQRVDEVAE